MFRASLTQLALRKCPERHRQALQSQADGPTHGSHTEAPQVVAAFPTRVVHA